MPNRSIYTKPYKDVSAQIALLQGRGLEITDTAAATACLERIGYYRLSGYWYPFRESRHAVNPVTGIPLVNPATGRQQLVVDDDFRSGTTFQTVMDLYVFDKRLRLLFLDAIERVEVALRVDIALLIGQRGAWAHRDPAQLHGNFTSKADPVTGHIEYPRWLERLDRSFGKSKDEFIKHFKTKYRGADLPIWIAIELWDFGMLSVFLKGMKHADQTALALKYGIPRPELLASWTRNINNVRNICAHHSRLWNRSPADQASPSQVGEIAYLDHVSLDLTAQSRIYQTAAILQFFLRKIHPGSSWSDRLKQHMKTLPLTDCTGFAQAGFPENWDTLPLWS